MDGASRWCHSAAGGGDSFAYEFRTDEAALLCARRTLSGCRSEAGLGLGLGSGLGAHLGEADVALGHAGGAAGAGGDDEGQLLVVVEDGLVDAGRGLQDGRGDLHQRGPHRLRACAGGGTYTASDGLPAEVIWLATAQGGCRCCAADARQLFTLVPSTLPST